MRLLFITQKLHGQDTFGQLWVRAFIRQGYDVTVLCLEDRVSPLEFPVYSMGKERGKGKVAQIISFWKHVHRLRTDRVFIHMSPVWGLLGAPWWILRRTPVYLWYTHYKTSPGLLALFCYAKRFFCATPQSLPQLKSSPRKVVTGHGIDLSAWPKRPSVASDLTRLLSVHRLSRSKRLELVIQSLLHLPGYTLDVYGIEAEPDYVAELRELVARLRLQDRVQFHGTVPMAELPAIYQRHRLILNMASETIDKSMLEAMTCGCYPVITKANAAAIGIPHAPAGDTPEAIAAFVQGFPGIDADDLYRIVQERHSLSGLISQMDHFIRPGI